MDVISAKTKEQLEKIANEILENKKLLRIGTTSLTPINYSEEREKFFASTTYNPNYKYVKRELPEFEKTIDAYKKGVDGLKIPEDLKEHILKYLDDQKNLYLTKKNIGKPEFSAYANRLFNWGEDRLDLLLTNTPKVKFKMHISHILQDSVAIKKEFERALQQYKINSFAVKIDSFSPHIINVGYRSINIGDDIRRFKCNVERLVVHEIESHVLQTENVKNAKTRLSEFSKYGNQNLYSEGLAIYNEIMTRKITPSAFEIYYYRIKAVRNLQKSFREIYNILLENLNPQRAFVMTYRVKRGLSDTSVPGGFPKDAAYLLGFYEIEKLVAEKYPKKLLYATKSPVLSSLLEKYGLLNTETVLTPQFR